MEGALSYIPQHPGYGGLITNATAAQQQRVIINAFFDMAYYEENFNNIENALNSKFMKFYDVPQNFQNTALLQGDLVFRRKTYLDSGKYKKHKYRYEGSFADNGAPRVFGTLNGTGCIDPDGTKETLYKYDPNSKEDYLEFIRSHYQFVGLAQGGFNASAEGLNGWNKRTDLAVQIGGIETIFNTGSEAIRAGERVVWNAPDPANLTLYPPRVNRIMKGREGSVFFSLEAYDPNKEFNLETLFKRHIKTFATCIGHDFGKDRTYKTHLPKSLDVFADKNSIAAYHHCLFTFFYAVGSIFEAGHQEYNINGQIDWDGPIKAAHVNKIMSKAQDLLHNGMNSMHENETERLRIKRILNLALISMEALYFADQTEIYRTSKSSFAENLGFKNEMGEITKTLFYLHSKITQEYQSRIIGVALTSAGPGHAFDIHIGPGRAI